MKRPIFEDLHALPENERIVKMGNHAMAGEKVGFVVEDDAKADRYIRTMITLFPKLKAVKGRGPFKKSVLVTVTIRETHEQSGK